jgi:phospholipid-binding lipoprotein MlaA
MFEANPQVGSPFERGQGILPETAFERMTQGGDPVVIASITPLEAGGGAASPTVGEKDDRTAALASEPATQNVVDVPDETADRDPWESFNVKTFWFNRQADRYVLKPVAKGWDWLLPDPVQRSVANLFDNIEMPKRVINNLLQLKFSRAGIELARFTVNSTLGIAGLFNPAKDWLGITKYDEDTGQTLGFYGVGPGPYLVLPLLPPLTVRDGIGFVVDLALNPLTYLVPTGVIKTEERVAISVVQAVNDRSLNIEFYQNVEEGVLDLYSAVRNAYLQRRRAAIRE